MEALRHLTLALGIAATSISPAAAVDLFDNNCQFAGQCAYDLPRGGRVFKPMKRDQPPVGIEVQQPGVVPVMPRPRLQVRPTVRDHLRWCSNRYRSYRASDDTYSPKAGIRRPCLSPYS